MEVEDMQTEEEKMELEDNTVGHNLNSSNICSIYFQNIFDTMVTVLSLVSFKI